MGGVLQIPDLPPCGLKRGLGRPTEMIAMTLQQQLKQTSIESDNYVTRYISQLVLVLALVVRGGLCEIILIPPATTPGLTGDGGKT